MAALLLHPKPIHLLHPKPIHPGELILEYIKFRNWTQRTLAQKTGLTPKTICKICNGKNPVTPKTALALEKVLQRPAFFWLNLQIQFDLRKTRDAQEVSK